MLVGRPVSFWEGLFSRATLNFGRVCRLFPKECLVHPPCNLPSLTEGWRKWQSEKILGAWINFLKENTTLTIKLYKSNDSPNWNFKNFNIQWYVRCTTWTRTYNALLVLPGPNIKSHQPTKTSGCWISCQALTPPPPVCWWNVPWKGPASFAACIHLPYFLKAKKQPKTSHHSAYISKKCEAKRTKKNHFTDYSVQNPMANGSLLIVNSDHSIIPHEMIQMDLKWWIAPKAFYEPVLILANIPKGLKGCSIRSMNLPRILEFTVNFSHTIVSSNVMFHSLPCLYLGRVRRLSPDHLPPQKQTSPQTWSKSQRMALQIQPPLMWAMTPPPIAEKLPSDPKQNIKWTNVTPASHSVHLIESCFTKFHLEIAVHVKETN